MQVYLLKKREKKKEEETMKGAKSMASNNPSHFPCVLLCAIIASDLGLLCFLNGLSLIFILIFLSHPKDYDITKIFLE